MKAVNIRRIPNYVNLHITLLITSGRSLPLAQVLHNFAAQCLHA